MKFGAVLSAMLLAGLCGLAGGEPARAATPMVDITAGADKIDLVPALMLMRDPGKDLTIEQAWAQFDHGAFQPLAGRAPSYGFTRDALWFALRVRNLDHNLQRWVLAIAQPRLDRVDVWWRHQDGTVDTAQMGDALPFATRSLPHRFPNAAIAFPRGDETTLMLRVESTSSIQLPLALYTPNALYRDSHDEQAGIGLYYGILLALVLYNLAVMLSIRDASYLYYVLYAAAFGLLMLAFNGVGFEYLWPDATGWQNASLPFAIGAVLCTSVAFARSFLDLRRNLPWVARAFDYTIALAAVVLLLSFTRWRYEATVALNVGIVIMSLAVTISAVVCALRGYRPAVYFLLAWTLLIAGGVALPLSSFGVIPRTVLTEYSVQFGSAAEMLLLSFSLAYRINLLRSANERIARDANELLERRVTERTLELELTAQHLAEANQRLRETSLRDGLTGVYNRRHLDQALTEAWHRGVAQSQPLSLLMIDIDHFKSINDRHGHVAGDDCLRAVASRLVAAGADAVVARYGGEEFMVVLAGADSERAGQRAEALRVAIAAQPVAIEGGSVSLTVSIGAATFDPRRGDSITELVRHTDQALYEAKRRGRNQVVLA